MTLVTWLASFLTFFNSTIIPLIIAVAFLFFIINAVRYFIIQGASEDGREKAKKLAIYGIAAFVIMLSLWGLVNIFLSAFGFTGLTRPLCPDYNPSCSSGQQDNRDFSDGFNPFRSGVQGDNGSGSELNTGADLSAPALNTGFTPDLNSGDIE